MPGRRFCSGENHPSAKLNDEKVLTMRRERVEGASVIFLSKKYAVAEMTVRNILSRHTWRHLPAD